MHLSEIGLNAYKCWLEIPEHFPFVKLDAFVIMPNHVHGIIIIDKPYGDTRDTNTPDDMNMGVPWDTDIPGDMDMGVPWDTDVPGYIDMRVPWDTDIPVDMDMGAPWDTDMVGGTDTDTDTDGVKTQYFASLADTTQSTPITPTNHDNPPERTERKIQTPSHQPSQNKYGPQSQNLGSIIRGFKIGVTIHAKNIRPEFKWQERYHDHIIRDKEEFARIATYIKMNPQNWDETKYYKK